jgi:hypothetical protein
MLVGRSPFKDNKDMMEREGRPAGSSKFTGSAEDLVRALLNPDPALRLHDWSEVKKHEFFGDVDWKAMDECKVSPPIVPDPWKVNFPIECEMEAVLMPEHHKDLPPEQKCFEGYTYDGHPESGSDMKKGSANIEEAEKGVDFQADERQTTPAAAKAPGRKESEDKSVEGVECARI